VLATAFRYLHRQQGFDILPAMVDRRRRRKPIPLIFPTRKPNPVEQAVAKVGGAVQACAICRVTPATLYDWRRKGYIRLLGPALRLARAADMLVEAFAPPDSLG
jgi:hypothetical protein